MSESDRPTEGSTDAGPRGWVSTLGGAHLRGRSNRNTSPEVAARRALHAEGYRFRLHVTLTRGCTPDVLLPKHRVAVFCHGDFWHGCPDHFPDPPGGPNSAKWAEKWRDNARRDARAIELAKSLGWEPVVVWECELRTDPRVVVRRVAAASGSNLHPADAPTSGRHRDRS